MTRGAVPGWDPVGVGIGVFSGAAVFLWTTNQVLGGVLRSWDRSVIPAAPPAGWPEPAGWRVLVDLGGAGFLSVALIAAAAVHLARRRPVRILLLAGGWIVATEATIWLAKVVIGRTPPRSGMDQVFAGGMSYPSGQTADAFTLLLIAVTLSTTPGSLADRITCWSVPAIAATVAIATVQLRYHWPSDAIAGWALGLSAGILARQSLRGRRSANGRQ